MEFSVLMSLYYKENPQYLKECIESILNQSIIPSEIVIVRDGPLTKELDSVIDNFKSIYKDLFKIVDLKENRGLGIALAIGVSECSYDLIARMDTDDICDRDRFKKQIDIFKKSKDIDMVGSYISEFENYIHNCIAIRTVPINNEEIINYAKKRNPFNHMTVMYKKESVLEAGNYKELLWNEDYYLWVRMIMNKCKFYNIPETLVYARTGNEMFERRGSKAYAKKEIELQKIFYNIGFINKYESIKNSILRSIVRVIPNKLRREIYLRLLRK